MRVANLDVDSIAFASRDAKRTESFKPALPSPAIPQLWEIREIEAPEKLWLDLWKLKNERSLPSSANSHSPLKLENSSPLYTLLAFSAGPT